MSVHVRRPSRVARTGILDGALTNDWRHAARCRDMDGELFFAVGTGPAAQEQDEVAKAICRSCPVREECLNEALAGGLDDGVFGGLTADERRALKNRNGQHTPGRRGFKRCEGRCGQWVVPLTTHHQKYCKPCAADATRQQKANHEKSHR